MKYRKKPVVIDAWQYTGDNGTEMVRIIKNNGGEIRRVADGLLVPTLEGEMFCAPGDWIICGIKGEFYPCKPDIFANTYEQVEHNESGE